MSSSFPSVARQALHQSSRRLSTSYRPRLLSSRIAATRSYVSESSPRNATINVESTIKADQKAFLAETGIKPKDATMPTTGMSAEAMMSPAAGILKQATVMDQGTRPIYLDAQATTPTDPRVLDAMLPYFTGLYGNPHSRTHAYGWETDKAVEQARANIAELIGADPKEIIFTSGATESNNMSIKGVARFFKRGGKKNHIITCQTEHKCVLDSCRHLQDEGFEVTYLPVQSDGRIDMKELEAAMRPDTMLVSIMAVNNEIGVVQPLEEIGKLCRSKKIFFHTDGAQAVGKIPLDVNKLNVDLMSISSHKLYGPKGIGACYVRRRPRVRLDPIISGGGQERGLRSGTLAPPLVIGFGEAARIAKDEMEVSQELLSPFGVIDANSYNSTTPSAFPLCPKDWRTAFSPWNTPLSTDPPNSTTLVASTSHSPTSKVNPSSWLSRILLCLRVPLVHPPLSSPHTFSVLSAAVMRVLTAVFVSVLVASPPMPRLITFSRLCKNALPSCVN